MTVRAMRLLAAAAALAGLPAAAYEFRNHFDMSDAAVSRSMLVADPAVLRRYGLESLSQEFRATLGENSSEFVSDCKHAEKFSIRLLIACGAQFEDSPATRVLNHFYDPINDGPLTVRFLFSWVRPGTVIGYPNLNSADWALEDNAEEPNQQYSYGDARNAQFLALTASTYEERQSAWGRTFQTLGHVIHHLQDMAQPQHVRNDQHLELKIPFYWNPSYFEALAVERERDIAIIAGDPAIQPVFVPGDSSPYTLPRDFWKNTSGTGLAQRVNRNFVSAGTNFDLRFNQQILTTRYREPGPGGRTDVAITQLDVSDEIRAFCEATAPVCTMSFYATREGTPDFNPRASALSIFDQYVQLRPVQYQDPDAGTYQVDRLFTLNRYTNMAAYERLVPQAVSYSAGLLNYFFRGKMRITLPNEGIYGILDHALPEGNDPATGGFAKIKLKIQNLTPGMPDQGAETIEPMSTSGKLRLVARFHRNTCYQANLSGEYGAPGIDWRTCRSPNPEIVVSNPVDAPAGINTAPQQLEFIFPPGAKLPISATDLFLQVVYSGPLGAEPNAIVAETKDISEPSYAYNFVTWDQHAYIPYPGLDPGTMPFDQWCTDGYPEKDSYPTLEACYQAMGTTMKFKYSADASYIPGYDPNNTQYPPATWHNLADEPFFAPTFRMTTPVGKFQRIAMLTDVTPTNFALLVSEQNDEYHQRGLFQWFSGTYQAHVNQRDPATDTLTPAFRYVSDPLLGRGVYVPEEEGPRVNGRAQYITVNPPNFVLIPSVIDF